MLQNGHANVTDISLSEMAEDVAAAAPHLGSVLSADLEDLPKGELLGMHHMSSIILIVFSMEMQSDLLDCL